MSQSSYSSSRRPIIWPIVVLVVAGILNLLERKPPGPSQQIDLIAVFDAHTNVFVARPDGWAGEVFGPNGQGGLMAAYASNQGVFLVLIQDAGAWTVDDAVSNHQKSLKSSASHLWCGSPEAVRIGDYDGVVFAYCDEGTLQNEQLGVQEQAGITHVVTTWVIHGKIFRTHVSTAGTIPPDGPDQHSSEVINQMKALALRIRFAPIDSITPINELVKL